MKKTMRLLIKLWEWLVNSYEAFRLSANLTRLCLRYQIVPVN
jgi:hypothetical protein